MHVCALAGDFSILLFNLICYLCQRAEWAGISDTEGFTLIDLPFYHKLIIT